MKSTWLFALSLSSLLFIVSCETTPSTGGTTPAASHGVSAGRSIYYSRCTACHAAYSPGKYSSSQWNGIVSRMRGRAKLSSAQTADLRAFLSANARG